MLLIGNLHIEHERAFVSDHLAECPFEVCFVANRRSAAAIAVRDLHEIGISLFGIGVSIGAARSARFLVVNRSEVSMGPVSAHEPIFPLHDHTEMLVVQQQHLHRQFFAEAGRQFLDIHLKTAIPVDINHQRIGMRRLGAHCGG